MPWCARAARASDASPVPKAAIARDLRPEGLAPRGTCAQRGLRPEGLAPCLAQNTVLRCKSGKHQFDGGVLRCKSGGHPRLQVGAPMTHRTPKTRTLTTEGTRSADPNNRGNAFQMEKDQLPLGFAAFGCAALGWAAFGWAALYCARKVFLIAQGAPPPPPPARDQKSLLPIGIRRPSAVPIWAHQRRFSVALSEEPFLIFCPGQRHFRF